jgi:hypothetical protein
MPQWEDSEARGEKRKSHLANGTRTGESTNLISLYSTVSNCAHAHFAVVELYLVIFDRIFAFTRFRLQPSVSVSAANGTERFQPVHPE